MPVPSLEGILGSKVDEAEQEGGEKEEEAPGVILGEGSAVHLEMENFDEGPPVIPVAAKVGPSSWMGYATSVLANLDLLRQNVIILG